MTKSFGPLAFASALLIAASAGAQTPSIQPFEPKVGQPGKDVVWVPTPQALVEIMLDLAKVTPDDYVIDLGSGDGRTVITAAKRGARAHGIEYNGDMVTLAQAAAEREGVSDKATFEQADLFTRLEELEKADVITMFLLSSLNLKLRPTLLDLEPGTRLVSNTFRMADWEADVEQSVEGDCASWCTALLWIVPAKVDGAWEMNEAPLILSQQFQRFSGTHGEEPVADGHLSGREIQFTIGGMRYWGTVDDDTMRGQFEGGGSWTATRQPQP